MDQIISRTPKTSKIKTSLPLAIWHLWYNLKEIHSCSFKLSSVHTENSSYWPFLALDSFSVHVIAPKINPGNPVVWRLVLLVQFNRNSFTYTINSQVIFPTSWKSIRLNLEKSLFLAPFWVLIPKWFEFQPPKLIPAFPLVEWHFKEQFYNDLYPYTTGKIMSADV